MFNLSYSAKNVNSYAVTDVENKPINLCIHFKQEVKNSWKKNRLNLMNKDSFITQKWKSKSKKSNKLILAALLIIKKIFGFRILKPTVIHALNNL